MKWIWSTSLGFALLLGPQMAQASIRDQAWQQTKPSAMEEVAKEDLSTTELRQRMVNELVEMGVAPAEADQRVAALTDQDIQKVKTLQDKPAGQDDTITIGVGAALLIVLILLIL